MLNSILFYGGWAVFLGVFGWLAFSKRPLPNKHGEK